MKKNILALGIMLLATLALGQSAALVKQVESSIDKNASSLEIFYKQLHQHPELSLHEEKTSKAMSAELRALGFDVIENIGGYSLAGVFKNGDGPTVLIRTDMDALPLQEATGLPYASHEKGINAAGQEVSVMHACGHDLHMTVFVGTARALVQAKKNWKGTLVMIAQASEENGMGAALMFKDGLNEKIPAVDYALALHDNAFLPAGKLGYNTGAFMASVDMIDIVVHGKGGHGAAPHTTIDPVVLSARMIMDFQTIVSREMNPLDPAVVTVGSIHGGTVHNIIPDQVKMQLTVRSYSPQVREHILSSIRRISRSVAESAGVPEDKMPEMTMLDPTIPATINDKPLTTEIVTVLIKNFGEQNVVEVPSSMVGEDFSRFGLQEKKVPICMFWLGAADPAKVADAEKNGMTLPSLHSSAFAPLYGPAIRTGIKAMSLAALHLFNK